MARFPKVLFALLAGFAALTMVRQQPAQAQVASTYFDDSRTVILSDRTTVLCKRAYRSSGANDFYYVPNNLHLAKGPDGTPIFMFMKYTTDKAEDKGGTQGALMHFLMEFGLSTQQMAELNQKLAQQVPGARCIGSVPLFPVDGESSTFEVLSGTLAASKNPKALVTSGKAPLIPGGRCAVAATMDANQAQMMAAGLERGAGAADMTVSFPLKYYSMVQGVTATMEVYGEKITREREKMTIDYHNTHKTTGTFLGIDCLWETSGEDSISYDESYEQFKYMRDKGYVKCNIQSRLPSSELNEKIITTFLQLFLEAFTTKQQMSPEEAQKQVQAQNQNPSQVPGVSGNHYNLTKYKRTRDKQIFSRKWTFTAEVPVLEQTLLTGNLMEWYSAVKDNPRCVFAVNLNDPFFTRRDVRFVLDLDAKEIFDETVNYVTVNVRKNRTTGRPFEDSLTIDAKYLKDNGVTSALTYARGEDKNPDVYQYQAQWSLKGGNIYPPNPPWQTGKWEGVTLTPPVKPLTVDLEGNFDDMKAKDITRITAQVHYYQFGQEGEANLQLSPAKGTALVSQKIFMDRDKKAYAYRLVYNHKTMGKLAGPWVGNISDGYIYAALPEDLLTNAKYKQDGENALTGVVDRILGQFK